MTAIIRTDVKNRNEAKAIAAGLKDPACRAFVAVVGILSELPSDRARQRVLTFITDELEERSSEKAE